MDNKKYYYIKLKDNYFDQDNIKILESMKNGHTYSLILIKLYLKSSKYNGRLMMTPAIPYDPNKIEILANVISHDIDNVKQAIKAAVELDLITIVEGREIWMTEIQNFIGKSSTEADRIREYRTELNQKLIGDEDVQMYDISTPELEKEIELKKERERKPKFKKPSVQEVKEYADSIGFTTLDPEYFINHYEANGWMAGRAKMKNWKATVVNWKKRDAEFKPKHSSEPDSDLQQWR